jgi:hypothetical protein
MLKRPLKRAPKRPPTMDDLPLPELISVDLATSWAQRARAEGHAAGYREASREFLQAIEKGRR